MFIGWGGNVTDLPDGLLLQAARLWQTCTQPNTQCVLERNQPTVDYQSDAGWTRERKDLVFRTTHEFVFVCLEPVTDLPEQPPLTSFSDEGRGGTSKQYRMRLNVLPAVVTTETIS